jgi:glutathione S-transferase
MSPATKHALTLYLHPFSTYSRRVRIALLEKNLEVDEIEVDMAARAHRKEPYLTLNPYGRVPTLVDGDLVLYESTAILDYIEARFPEPSLVPADIKQRALVDMHMKLCDLQFTRPGGVVIFSKRFIPEAKWRLDEMAKARGEVEKHFKILERQLEGQAFLAGDSYTLADVCYVPFLEFMALFEVEPPPNVKAWSDRLLARPTSIATKPAH